MTGLHFWCSTVCLSSDRIHDDIQFFVSCKSIMIYEMLE